MHSPCNGPLGIGRDFSHYDWNSPGPTMTASFHQPEHWRQRAQEMRTLACEIRDLVARASMLEIADQYESIALRAGDRLRFSEDGRMSALADASASRAPATCCKPPDHLSRCREPDRTYLIEYADRVLRES